MSLLPAALPCVLSALSTPTEAADFSPQPQSPQPQSPQPQSPQPQSPQPQSPQPLPPQPLPPLVPQPLTDDAWATIAPLLPPGKAWGRQRSTNLRHVVAAIHYRWQAGCAWRNLPAEFPAWPTVYTYFRSWLKDGTLRQLRAVLNPPRPSAVARKKRRRAERERRDAVSSRPR